MVKSDFTISDSSDRRDAAPQCAACEIGWVRLALDGAECHPNPRDPRGPWLLCPAMMTTPEAALFALVSEIVAEYPYKTRAEEDAALGVLPTEHRHAFGESHYCRQCGMARSR